MVSISDILKGWEWFQKLRGKAKQEEKQEREDNKVIKVLQEQLDKAEARELEDAKRIIDLEQEAKRLQNEMNELLRDLIKKKANKK